MLSRITRILRHLLVGCCALLTLGLAGLWARSYWRSDEVGWFAYQPSPGTRLAAAGGRDSRCVVGSSRGGAFWLRTQCNIAGSADWYGGEPTETIRCTNGAPRLAEAAARSSGAPFRPVPLWSRGGFRFESNAPAPTPGAPWYRGIVAPYWPFMLAAAWIPALRLRRLWVRRRRCKRGLCLNCGYDVRASGEVCSECGHSLRPPPPMERPAVRRRARSLALATAAALLAAGAACLALRSGAHRPPAALRLAPGISLPSGQQPQRVELDLGSGVALRFVRIPAGRFLMGSPPAEDYALFVGRLHEEQHEATIDRPFYLGETEVTQEQYEAVMRTNPSRFRGPKNPVEQVHWEEATAFCQRLSALTGRRVRLPTEIEWEYACRAGTSTPFNTGAKLGRDDANWDVGIYPANRDGRVAKSTLPVASYHPNAWGLYDMHGNVWEWCSDWFAPDPTPGPAYAQGHVLRGGSWGTYAQCCRSAFRHQIPADHSDRSFFGFRVLLALP